MSGLMLPIVAVDDYIQGKVEVAVRAAQKRVWEEFKKNLNAYYFNDPYPKVYKRQDQLMESLVPIIESEFNSSANECLAEVWFDPNRMKYPTTGVETQMTNESGHWSGYVSATGDPRATLDAALSGSHGGKYSGTAIWDETMKGLGGKEGIKSIIKSELKKAGLNIR